jgi:hypothetical protein
VVTVTLLAEDFFRLAHDDHSGRPLLHRVALSTGLAAALFGDLIAQEFVWIDNGYVGLRPRRDWPQEQLPGMVLALLRRESHPLPTWLEFLQRDAYGRVGRSLETSGQYRAERSRRGVRTMTTYVPTNSLEAARPRAVLATRLTSGQSLDPWYVCLGGFMAATGLDATGAGLRAVTVRPGPGSPMVEQAGERVAAQRPAGAREASTESRDGGPGAESAGDERGQDAGDHGDVIGHWSPPMCWRTRDA